MDRNFVHVKGMKGVEPASELARQSGNDRHSLKGDALFSASGLGDFPSGLLPPPLNWDSAIFPWTVSACVPGI